jgi:8-oxo-dGTP diphosphatase
MVVSGVVVQHLARQPEPVGPSVGVGVLVVDDDDRVLLTLRRRPPEAGSWSILGGRVELLETLHTCAIREAREEAGIDIVVRQLLCVTDHILPAERQHWVSPAFLASIVTGDARNLEPEKTAALEWFDLAELPRNLTMTARRAVDAYRAIGTVQRS